MHAGKPLTQETSRINLAEGDLWDWYEKGHRVVVTTNIGWNPRNGRNNMGAGMALQAAARFMGDPSARMSSMPGRVVERDSGEALQQPLDVWYGSLCEQLAPEVPVLAYPYEPRILLFPVKPLLDRDNPERSWDQVASYDLIIRSLHQLRTYAGKIALSYPGGGNGKLDPLILGRLVENILGQDPDPGRFTLVTFKPSPHAGEGWPVP